MSDEQNDGTTVVEDGEAVPAWFVLPDDDFNDEYPYPASGRPRTELQRRILRALRSHLRGVPRADLITSNGLMVSLQAPLPANLRFYSFTATQHASERQADTFRVQLTLGERGRRARFSREDRVRPILIGYEPRLDVFILWDADLHDVNGFAYSRGVQAPPDVVYRAVSAGVATAPRHLKYGGIDEIVVACRASRLVDGLVERIRLNHESVVAEST